MGDHQTVIACVLSQMELDALKILCRLLLQLQSICESEVVSSRLSPCDPPAF